MQALSQSAFLQALGYAIANSLWQAALVWLLVAAANGLFKFTSHVKYRVALAAQFSAFIWFVLTLQFYYTKCGEAIAQMQYSGLTNANAFELQPGTASFSAILLSAILKGEKLLPYLSIGYLLLLSLLGARWIRGYRQTQIIKTQGLGKIDVEWRLFVKRISEMLAIKQKVQIFVSDFVKSPLTVGFLKPLILIPIASINSLTTEQLEALILHELAHIRRADYLINIIQSIIEVALFFNPFTQLISKIIKRERENSCDDWVLQFQYDPAMYAEALLRIACMQQRSSGADAFAMNAKGNKDHDLLWRVKRMLHQKERSFQYRNRMLALLLITGVVSSIAWLQPAVKSAGAVAKTAKPQQPVVVEPLAVKIDNPLYNPISFFNGALKEEVQKATDDATREMAKSTDGLANIGSAVSDKISTINVDLPGIMSKTGDEVNKALANVDFNNTDAADAKGLNINLDSLKQPGFLQNAIKVSMNKVDWSKVNGEISKAKQEVKNELKGVDLGGFTTAYITQLVNKSLDITQKAMPSGDANKENDGDNDAELVAPGGFIIKALKAGKEKRILEFKKVGVDSAHKSYSKTKSLDIESEEGVGTIGNLQGFYNVAPEVSYSSVSPKYFPASFDLNTKLHLTINTDNNVAVSSKDNSTLIAVKQDDNNDNSYEKKITIETLGADGQRHIFHVTIEMYQ